MSKKHKKGKPIKRKKTMTKPKPTHKPASAKKAVIKQPKAPITPKVEFQAPKGTRDFFPEDMDKRRAVIEGIRNVFSKYNYGQVQTPAFESLELLEAKGSLGDEAVKDIYRFVDKSDRPLGLRYDPTTPIARIVANNPDMPKPIRWYYMANMWRYEDTNVGRYREFWQCGIELIGPTSPASDAEVLQILCEAISGFGLEDFTIHVNSRKILDAMAKKVKAKEPEKIFRILDKLGKKDEKEVREELKATGLSAGQATELLKMARSDERKMKGISGLKELSSVLDLIDEKYRKFIKIDFSISRGLDYYTGIVFETTVKGSEAIGSIASGGRYDNLIERYGGKPTPAIGFGIGLDRLVSVLEERGIVKNTRKKLIAVLPVSDDMSKQALGVAAVLRNFTNVLSCFADRNLSKNLEYAGKKHANFAVIVGPNDLAENSVTVRDMNSGEERKFLIKDLEEEIKKWERSKLFY